MHAYLKKESDKDTKMKVAQYMVAVGLLVSRNIISLGIVQFLLRENQKLV